MSISTPKSISETHRKPYVEILDHIGASASERVREIKSQKAKALGRYRMERERKLNNLLQKALRTDISKLAQESENSLPESAEDGFQSYYKIDIQELLQKDKFLPVLWRRIRAKVSYRPEHLLAQIGGHVRIRAHVDKRGKLIRLMDESAQGRSELLGWVMVCIADALKDPVLTQEMSRNIILDLNFYFLMGEIPPQETLNTAKMVFAIQGAAPRGLLQNLANGRVTDTPVEFRPLTHPALADAPPMLQVPLLRLSTDEIANFFKEKTLKNHSEWSFFSREEQYKHHCERARNPNGCALLARLYRSIGKNQTAQKYEALAQSYESDYEKR